MKIAYYIPSIHHSGGMERVLSLKANYFADVFGYDIYIITTDGKGQKPFFPFSPQIKQVHLDVNFDDVLRASTFKKLFGYLWKQRVFKKRLKKTLFEIRPDITISMLRRDINFINSIKDGSRKIGEFHFAKNNYRKPKENSSFIEKKFFYTWWMNQLANKLKKLDQFVVLTHEDKVQWTELNRITVIPNPIAFFPDQVSDCSSHQVIAVGRYTYQKGFDLLIEAWNIISEKHPDWILRIYGGGEKKRYQQFADSLKLPHTCILESVAPNIDEKFRESSIFVLSSRFEGFGMVLAEAMSCGLPAVSFNCACGPSEIIKDNEDGFLVELGNIEGLAEQINYLIEHDEVRIQMGHQARKNIERFKIEHIAQQWKDLFESVITQAN